METEQMYEMAGGRGAGGVSPKMIRSVAYEDDSAPAVNGLQQQLLRLREQVNSAHENLSVLEKHVGPILVPEAGLKDAGVDRLSVAASPIGEQVGEIQAMLGGLNERIHNIIERVAL
jgi:hypothetical protein